MSLYNSQELHDVMTQIDQQLLRYFTACENEQHHLNVSRTLLPACLSRGWRNCLRRTT